MKRVLILGGGFAGVKAAMKLQKNGHFDVTLISEREYLYSYPISIWVPVHIKKFEDLKLPISKIQKKYPFRFHIDKVVSINAFEKKVICQDDTYTFDYLIVATGSAKMKPKGIENTYSVCGKPESIVDLTNKLDELVAKGSGKIGIGFGGNPLETSAVRGGPAFEFVFNLDNYLNKLGIRQNFDITFFAPMANPGVKMGGKAIKMIEAMFKKKGLKKAFGLKIKEFTQDGVIFEDGSKLDTDLTMFIAAGSGSELFKNSGLPLSNGGFIKVRESNQVEGFRNIYAIGDAVAYEGPDWISKQGHIAEVMGENAAFNIIETEKGGNNYKSYKKALKILCVMDTGNGAALVYRDQNRSVFLPMPYVGHLLKVLWSKYSVISKTR